MLSDCRFAVEDILDSGDRVVLLYHQAGKAKETGVEVEERAAWVYTVHNGKIARVEMFQERCGGPAGGRRRDRTARRGSLRAHADTNRSTSRRAGAGVRSAKNPVACRRPRPVLMTSARPSHPARVLAQTRAASQA